MSALITPVSPSCALCSSPIPNSHGTNTVYLRCPDISHVFHRTCIAQHIRSSGPDADKCPACMTPISAENRRIIPLNNVQLPTELQSPVLRAQPATQSPALREARLQEDAIWLAERAAARQREPRRTSFHSVAVAGSTLSDSASRIREIRIALETRLGQPQQIHPQISDQNTPVARLAAQMREAPAVLQDPLSHVVEQVPIPTPPSPPSASSSFSTLTTLRSITTTFGSAITTTRRAVVIAAAVATIACLIFFPMVTSVLTYTLVSALLPAPFPTITTNVVIVIAQLIFMRTFIFPGTLCNVPNWRARLW